MPVWRCRSRPSGPWAGGALFSQLEGGLADADPGAELEGRRLGEPVGADVGPVRRAEVLDEPLVAGAGDPGVPGGDVVVVEADGGVGASADEDRRLVERDGLTVVGALHDRHVRRSTARPPRGLAA